MTCDTPPHACGSPAASTPGRCRHGWAHESIATTNLYQHFLGTGAHRAGLERLNRSRGATGGPSLDSIGE